MEESRASDANPVEARRAAEAAIVEPFPWPPAEDENVIFAAGETWRRSLFQPSQFFAAMPREGWLSALAYYLPLGIIGAALELFWGGMFDVLGVDSSGGMLASQAAANPALERLMGFLLSPLTLLVALFIGSALVHLMLKLQGAARSSFEATTRVLAFSSGTGVFLALPWIGWLVAGIWSLVIAVIGLRVVHETSTLRALAAMVLPMIALALVIIVVTIIALVAGVVLPMI